MISPQIRHHPVIRLTWLVFAILTSAAMVLGLYVGLKLNPSLGYRLQQQTISNAQNQSVLKANGIPTVGPPATDISKGNATAVAPAISPTTPAPIYKTGPQGPQGPGPTSQQIQTAVDRYFTVHPVKSPISAAALTEKVAGYVAQYLRAHPAPQGSPGPSGVPGPTPSDEQIAVAVQNYLPAAVAVYLAANPPASGPAGPSGPPGSSVVGPSGPPGPPIGEWQWTDPDTGVTHVCTHTGSTSTGEPAYSCTSVSPTPPTSGSPN